MNQRNLKALMSDDKLLNQKIKFYEEKGILTKIKSTYEIKGHLEKAKHNLSFVSDIKNNYKDWILVVCYYASYHCALALIIQKGYFSKNHDATICTMIKEYYNRELTKEEIEYLNMFDVHEILFYAESKNKREEASYSTKIKFDSNIVNNIKIKTRLFVNKAQEIINNN